MAVVSSLYSTPPWGKTDQPAFLNAAAALDTALSPRALLDLARVQALEDKPSEAIATLDRVLAQIGHVECCANQAPRRGGEKGFHVFALLCVLRR